MATASVEPVPAAEWKWADRCEIKAEIIKQGMNKGKVALKYIDVETKKTPYIDFGKLRFNNGFKKTIGTGYIIMSASASTTLEDNAEAVRVGSEFMDFTISWLTANWLSVRRQLPPSHKWASMEVTDIGNKYAMPFPTYGFYKKNQAKKKTDGKDGKESKKSAAASSPAGEGEEGGGFDDDDMEKAADANFGGAGSGGAGGSGEAKEYHNFDFSLPKPDQMDQVIFDESCSIRDWKKVTHVWAKDPVERNASGNPKEIMPKEKGWTATVVACPFQMILDPGFKTDNCFKHTIQLVHISDLVKSGAERPSGAGIVRKSTTTATAASAKSPDDIVDEEEERPAPPVRKPAVAAAAAAPAKKGRTAPAKKGMKAADVED